MFNGYYYDPNAQMQAQMQPYAASSALPDGRQKIKFGLPSSSSKRTSSSVQPAIVPHVAFSEGSGSSRSSKGKHRASNPLDSNGRKQMRAKYHPPIEEERSTVQSYKIAHTYTDSPDYVWRKEAAVTWAPKILEEVRDEGFDNRYGPDGYQLHHEDAVRQFLKARPTLGDNVEAHIVKGYHWTDEKRYPNSKEKKTLHITGDLYSKGREFQLMHEHHNPYTGGNTRSHRWHIDGRPYESLNIDEHAYRRRNYYQY